MERLPKVLLSEVKEQSVPPMEHRRNVHNRNALRPKVYQRSTPRGIGTVRSAIASALLQHRYSRLRVRIRIFNRHNGLMDGSVVTKESARRLAAANLQMKLRTRGSLSLRMIIFAATLQFRADLPSMRIRSEYSYSCGRSIAFESNVRRCYHVSYCSDLPKADLVGDQRPYPIARAPGTITFRSRNATISRPRTVLRLRRRSSTPASRDRWFRLPQSRSPAVALIGDSDSE